MTQNAGDVCETVNTLVDSERERIGRILENLDATTTSLRTFSETISDNPSLLIRSRDAEPLPETR
jgi:ABC-type transporter Mla subunit MlaD